MHLLTRQTQLADLPNCAKLIPSHHFSNGNSQTSLIELWEYLIGQSCAISAVIEDRTTNVHTIVGFGLSFCVPDSFIDQISHNTEPYTTKTLISLWEAGDFPALTLTEIRTANKANGLNVFGMHTIWGHPDQSDQESAPIRDRMLESLFATHRGYNIRSFTKEIYGVIEKERHESFGFSIRNEYNGVELAPNILKPYLIGMSREEALHPSLEGRHIRNLFLYSAPRCTFTSADQELLQLALTGLSETGISERLKISKESVKSRWDSVYQHIPGVLDFEIFQDGNITQKSRALLHWVRNHPEELQPTLFIP